MIPDVAASIEDHLEEVVAVMDVFQDPDLNSGDALPEALAGDAAGSPTKA